MKKAYSMMELIFVIVIIGILASVAAPKLFVTKDDALKAQLLNTIQEVKKGIEAYKANALLNEDDAIYPEKLCASSETQCPSGKGLIFDNILQKPVLLRNSKCPSSGKCQASLEVAGWDSFDSNYYYFPKTGSADYYAFSYDNSTGEFKCDASKTNTNHGKALDCKELGM